MKFLGCMVFLLSVWLIRWRIHLPWRRHRRFRFDPWITKISWGGNGNPLQYSFLRNPMEIGFPRSWTQLSNWHIHIYIFSFLRNLHTVFHGGYNIIWILKKVNKDKIESANVKEGRIDKVKVAQSCLTLCDPMDYIVHGILSARILGWVAFPFSRRSSQPRNRTQVSSIAGRLFSSWATKETTWELIKYVVEIQVQVVIVYCLNIHLHSNVSFLGLQSDCLKKV